MQSPARQRIGVVAGRTVLAVLVSLSLAVLAHAQGSDRMTFFVTSVGNGAAAGNYGGLAGADARCQALAAGVGAANRTWRAYLSTAPIPGSGGVLVHARDRIGLGPWRNYGGAVVAADLAELHASGIDPLLMLTELGTAVPGTEREILTGSEPDGTAMEEFPGIPGSAPPTCMNWTSNSPSDYGFVGYSDWLAGESWNSEHENLCDQAGMQSTSGSGRLYCFASLIFADGFESGDTAGWSLTVP